MIPIITVTVVFFVYFQTRPITDVKCYTVTNDTNHYCYCRVPIVVYFQTRPITDVNMLYRY